MTDIAEVIEAASRCRKCGGIDGRRAVLGRANGPAPARLMLIAEAPGRLGADRTRISLHGDRSGDNFESLLAGAGIGRGEVFITNAVLCNPRDGGGRNRRPNVCELRNCLVLLERQIEAVDPELIATLGATALAALAMIEEHGLRLSRDVGSAHRWRGRRVVPLYHPSPRAMARRPFDVQRNDYAGLARLLFTQS